MLIFGSTEAQEILKKDKARGYLAITLVDCPDCEGAGSSPIECGECGSEYDAECDACDGEGQLTTDKFLKLDARYQA